MSPGKRISQVSLAASIALIVVGCNAILDNERGNLIQPVETEPDDDASAPPPGDDDDTDAGQPPTDEPDASEPADPSCPDGQRRCFGTCVSLTDPLYGCGDPSCNPCPSNHGTATCQGRTCIISACDKGYADCNAKPKDGCETDLSKPASCGACNAACGAANPLCSPVGGSFECTNGCTPAAPLACGAECVDPLSSANHCGACNKACAPVDNGTVACSLGQCSFTCKPAFHACTDKCVAKTDPAFCGPNCTPCPAPAGGTATCVNDVCGGSCPASTHLCGAKCVGNDDVTACGPACTVCPVPANAAAATCAGNACGFTCTAGFGDCDKDPATGCESTLASDPANCGACGKKCKADETCVQSACAKNEPPPP